MKKILLFISVFASCLSAIAQHEADKWFFGTNAGLSFASGSPVVISSSMNTAEGCSAVSDATGRLRFYTNGVSVWDSTNTVMTNGVGLMGDISSTQSAIVVPSPMTNSQYYIFTTAADGGGGFRYSIVDMTLRSGLGDIMIASKNTLLTDTVTEKIAAISDMSNGYWIVAHKWGNDAFYAYHLTSSGFAPPVISHIGTIITTTAIQNTYGQMKFDMCGDKLALALGYLNELDVFDFDLSTGIVSTPLSISMPDHVYGIEFSRNSNLLYASCYDVSGTLVQFNISLGTLPLILASRTPLTVTADLYGLQLGPDGKIYVARSYGTSFLGVINSPNTVGVGCNYVDNGVDLDPGLMGINGALDPPGFMQSYLKIGVTCLTTGMAENSTTELNPVFPNPSSDEFTFQFNQNEKAQVIIYDYIGKKIEEFNSSISMIHFGKGYAKGVYFMEYMNGAEVKTVKVVKM